MKIKLLQWNIFYKEKIENVAALVKELNPDVVCLQELGVNCKFNASVPSAAEFVKKELGFNAFFKEAQRWENDSELDAIGNGIFSRFPILRSSSEFVQNQSKEFTDYMHEGRIYVETDLQIGNGVLTVATIHLSYSHKFEITHEKKIEVNNFLSLVNGKKERFVVTGDFNSTPTSYTIEELSKRFRNISPSYEENTWTTKPFDHNGFKEDQLNWRLDYVFGTKDMKLVSSEIVQTELSDHLPILVELDI